MAETGTTSERTTLSLEGLARLMRALRDDGFEIFGPRVRDGAILYDVVHGIDDLPRGVGDEQAPGRYRLRERGDAALFGWASPAHSFKRELLVPHTVLVRVRRSRDGVAFEAPAVPLRKRAFFGIRACDLAGIAVQDRVLDRAPYRDPDYAARRRDVLVIAVNCGEPSGTCFCVSMDTGPRARDGFDLALTELLDEHGHRFVAEVGTAAGRRFLDRVPHETASGDDERRADAVVAGAAERMGRSMDTTGIRELLYDNQEHPRWDHVAARCLGCANCTNACPTCFCTSVADTTDLAAETAERARTWDSCFTMQHSYVHGGTVRGSLRARYRQWLTHKVASWIDQFDTSGCVGCGRCITWCPVGIDITEEVAALRGEAR